MTLQITQEIRKNIADTFREIASFDVSLKKISRWKIGGIAQVVITPQSINELQNVFAKINEWRLPYIVIAGTSNLLFDSKGLDAIAIQIGPSLSKITIQDTEIIAEAGLWVPCLARKAMQKSLTGLEHICGIPGTLGGLVYMNGGSQRKGIASAVQFVETIDSTGRLKRYNYKDCKFSYRDSVFQNKNEIIVRVGLKLNKARRKQAIHHEMLNILKERTSKFPRRLPNCGSTFLGNPDMYAEYGPPGKVIEECGFKGFKIGGAVVAQEHANFINNIDEATSNDVLETISKIQDCVYKKTGYLMNVEARFVMVKGVICKIGESF